MVCRVCLLSVKKSAVICESCSLITHSKCASNSPPTCDLRAQLLLYAQYAEKGNPGGVYSSSVDPLKSHMPSSPMSEVAYVSPPLSSKRSIDILISQSPVLQESPGRPSTGFKFMAAFKTKRSRASLTLEPDQLQSSSTPSLPAPSDTHNQTDHHEYPRAKEKALPKKPSALDPNPRPHSLSSSSTTPNSSSMRSAADSFSSRPELGRKSAVTDAGTRSRPTAGEFGATKQSHLMLMSRASSVAADDDDSDRIPGGMPLHESRHHRKDSKSGNCAVQ
jgi:hypothetical protein